MKKFDFLKTIFLLLLSSCTDYDEEDLTRWEMYPHSNHKPIHMSWPNYSHFNGNWRVYGAALLVVACLSAVIYGGIYVYRNGWRSLLPKSWRNTDN